MDLSTWMTFVAASVVLVIIPGPTVLLVLSYALTQGRRVATASALGVGLGDLIAMTACLAGLGAIVLASSALFAVVKFVGAAYLIWMGLSMIRATLGGVQAQPLDSVDVDGDVSAGLVFRNAAVVTALNPKAIGFFIAFVPQFIDEGAPLVPQFIILIATFASIGALNAMAYALLANRLRAQIRKPAVLVWLTRLGGSVLIAMGVLTATLRKAA